MTRLTGAVLGLFGGAVVGGWLAVLLAIGLFVATDGQMSSSTLMWAGVAGGACGAAGGAALGTALAARSRRPGRYVAAHDVWGKPLSQVVKQPKRISVAESVSRAGSPTPPKERPEAHALPEPFSLPPLLLDERLTRQQHDEGIGRHLVYARGTIPLNGNVRIISQVDQDVALVTYPIAVPTGAPN
jgi:hypothetical protein